MNATWTIIAVAAAAALVGAWIGGRRLLALAVGTAVAAGLTPTAGPALAEQLATRTQLVPWVAAAAGWALAYAAILWLSSLVVMCLTARGGRGQAPSRTGRLAGTAVGF